jgi:GNAT superfamily N-acetyltransferase
MLQIIRTNSEHPDFIELVKLLDAELAIRDGDDHDFYHQFNQIDSIRHVVVAYEAGKPIACGALKTYAPAVAEVKRMFVRDEARGRGIATQILAALERWARELAFNTCILETGKQQPEAIRLYLKTGYTVIPNYGQYAGVDNSVCFEKKVS